MEYAISILPQMWVGVLTTLKVHFVAILPVLPLGVLFAISKVAGPKPLRWLLNIYTWAWRGTPLLLQLMIVKFGLPYLGINIPEFYGATLVFALNTSAYVTEIMRGAIQSIDRGQYEAAKALGIPYWTTMFRIVLPQAFRIALPSACSEAINLIKDTAIISLISLQDITKVTQQIFARDHNIIVYVEAFCIYLILTSVLVFIFNRLEKRFGRYEQERSADQ